MAEASIDIRVIPNKEMTSVDFAELMDTAIFNNGVIQGCETKIENGIFTISSGRIVVGGSLGVVTGGTVPNPTTLTKTEKCYPLAVCDLSNNANPFYFLIATAEDLARLGLDTEDENTTFNIDNSIKALTFGICDVDPATGLASNYEAWGQATAKKGWDWYNKIVKQITDLDTYYNNKLTWKIVKEETGQNWVRVPEDAKEFFVTVWVSRSSANKTGIDFHLPFSDHMFVTDATIMSHANGWPSDSDGFAEIRLLKNVDGHWVTINRVYNGKSLVTSSTTWIVMYR